jgi:hypothetical protein
MAGQAGPSRSDGFWRMNLLGLPTAIHRLGSAQWCIESVLTV